ncbi:hypothetical protein L1889_09135 [Paenalcaligenes niemegkensis]|uniref:glycine betaine ABC transporter substrate-binding protein n=1 Tax=Paenalcaligenes niemegkensis TaxID=2895469 RepID=UPI001EE8CC11|nr:glycine betaine ABC transporter substrate-binding protein [Paenalcaligenes niemegkensis]MCQ9616845.1 hypothetical protein [Paenalcaligenes niemegkensis]
MPTFRMAALHHRLLAMLMSRGAAIRMGVGLTGILAMSNVAAVEPAAVACEVDRPVRLVAMDWDSNRVLLEVERFIIEHGYGCQTETQAADVQEGLQALMQGDIDINTEVWLNSVTQDWHEAEDNGQVKRLGELYLGGDTTFVPSAVIKATEQDQAENDAADSCSAGSGCSEDPLAYPDQSVFTGINSKFSEQAPQLSAFLANIRIQPELMDETLAYMNAQEAPPEAVAQWFLSEHEDVWTQWLPMHVALRVKAAL